MSKRSSEKTERKKSQPKSVQNPPLIEPPAIFAETFQQVIPLLITRFQQWDILLSILIHYFNHKRDTANTLSLTYQSAATALSQMTLKPSVVNTMNAAQTKESSLAKAKVKLDKFTDTFNIMGRKWEFEYAPNGGVEKNFARLKDEVEQRALLEISHRDYIIDNVLTKLEKQREIINRKRCNELSDWKTEFEEAEELRQQCVSARSQLIEATTMAKTTRDMTPLPQHDPALKFLQYRSLRETWINKTNNLQFGAILHQETSKTIENELVESLQSLIKDYLSATIARNLKLKGIFSEHPIPIDGQEEWTYFTSHHNAVPPPTLDRALVPRQLRLLNDDHWFTKPAAVAMLVLQPLFPFSFNSSKTARRYVVTHHGFLIKASENEMIDPIPRRGFRLSDTNIWLNVPVGGKQSFVVRGVNCCRYGSMLSMATDRRTCWKFTGSQADVKAMMAVIQKKMPILKYGCSQLR
jgi:hypothetical protein